MQTGGFSDMVAMTPQVRHATSVGGSDGVVVVELYRLYTKPAAVRRSVVSHSTNHFEAPNWSLDGSHFVFNSQGSLFRLPVKGGTPERLDTGFGRHCNNDHGFSPDGKWIVISDHSQAGGKSLIYIKILDTPIGWWDRQVGPPKWAVTIRPGPPILALRRPRRDLPQRRMVC